MELKTCPCCGSPAQMVCTQSLDYFVRCTDKYCGVRTKNCHENENGAAMIWNTRVEQ